MTDRVRLAAARSFFLAGVMQGSRSGAAMVDQSYRRHLCEVILAAHPEAVINDPGELMVRWMSTYADAARAAHAQLAEPQVIRRAELDPALTVLTEVFDRLVGVSADSDVCVAWLPDQEASMGTAAEMWAAHAHGRLVIAITPMRQNLAVLACSDVIVPSLDAFAAWLTQQPVGAGAGRG